MEGMIEDDALSNTPRMGIGYSTMQGKIFVGMQRIEDGYISWVGEKEDITEQFAFVLYQFLEDNNFREITTNYHDEVELQTNIFFNVPKDQDSINDAIQALFKIKSELQ